MAEPAAPRATGNAMTDRRGAENPRRGRNPSHPSGKPVGIFAPMPMPARSHRQFEPCRALVELEHFHELDRRADDVRPDDGRIVDLYRQPGHRPGHLRDFRRGRKAHYGGDLAGRWILTAASRHGRRAAARATMTGAALLAVECVPRASRSACDRLS